MTASNAAADSGRPSFHSSASPTAEIREFEVKRDGARPYAFRGIILAEASKDGLAFQRYRAAVYQTVGGKFITTMTKEDLAAKLSAAAAVQSDELLGISATKPKATTGQVHKADVFASLEEAMAWFRPGPLTDSIRKQLGLDDPIRIE
jgi:hypothetical protein